MMRLLRADPKREGLAYLFTTLAGDALVRKTFCGIYDARAWPSEMSVHRN